MADEFFDSAFSSDYMGEITDAWFGVNPSYTPNVLRYFVKFKLDTPIERQDGGVITQIVEEYNCGDTSDWESTDGGKTAHHVGGSDSKTFASNSDFAALIRRLIDIGVRDQLVARGFKKGNPYNASVLVGMRLHIETEEQIIKPFKNKQGELISPAPKRRQWPTEYLGGQDALPLTQAAAKSGAVDLSFVDPAILQVLKNTAQSCATYAQFLDAALKIEGVADNDKLVDVIANESTYTQLAAV